MEEKIFLQQGSVLVSSSRVEINGQTFATRNIGSVKVTAPGINAVAVLLVIIGAAVAYNSSAMGGLICMAVGGLWAYGSWLRRELKIVAGGGEILALEDNNPSRVETIRAAIAEAISVR